MNIVHNSLRNWIPYKITHGGDDMLMHWLYTHHLRYIDPFFDSTIQKSKQYPQFASPFKPVSTVGMLAEWASLIDSVPPTALIFHVSRCGSTLVSQALGINSNSISVSEVPLFDDILRLPLQGHNISEREVGELLSAAVAFHGAKRNGNEDRYFIKADSWHLMFYKQLRALYPALPFIIIYREPAAVLESNRRLKGVQALPGLVEPALYNFTDIERESFHHPDTYMPAVLEKFYEAIIHIATTDNNTLLLNYNDGLITMMQQLAQFTGIAYSPEEEAHIAERSGYNAKFPGEKFVEQNKGDIDLQAGKLTELYSQINAIRAASRQKAQ